MQQREMQEDGRKGEIHSFLSQMPSHGLLLRILQEVTQVQAQATVQLVVPSRNEVRFI